MESSTSSPRLLRANVEGGRVTGLLIDGVRIYKGMPYAAPPVGDLRWKPPQPVTEWQGIRNCDSYGPECPQLVYPDNSVFSRPPAPQSEDCLYLNVWTAAEDSDEKRAVMVWIHGGSLNQGAGSAPFYEGSRLAKKGVVVVTINYRLGVFGYLAHPELTEESTHQSSGNYGVLDQIAALEWVQQHIAQFGGDPDNVTIFGESAGSWSANVLVASPLAKGLFHKAIGQSGAFFGPMFPLESADDKSVSAEKLGCDFARAAGAQSAADLRSLPVAALLGTFGNTPEGIAFQSRPNVDGWVLPRTIREIFESGQQNAVPTLLGSNADEWTAFLPEDRVPKDLKKLHYINQKRFGEAAMDFDHVYSVAGDEDVRRAYLESYRDAWFTLPMRRWARANETLGRGVYLYFFSHVPPTKNRAYLGAYHAAEIPYVFQNLDRGRTAYGEEDALVSDWISDYWVNFAKTGNPNGNGLPPWHAYDRQSQHYLEIGNEIRSGQRLLETQLDFLDQFPGVK